MQYAIRSMKYSEVEAGSKDVTAVPPDASLISEADLTKFRGAATVAAFFTSHGITEDVSAIEAGPAPLGG